MPLRRRNGLDAAKWLVQCAMFACFYYSILLGVMTIRVDYKQRRIHRMRRYAITAACSNIIIVSSYPIAAAVKLSLMRRNFFANPLAQLSMNVRMGLFSAVLLASLVLRCSRERRFVAMTRELFALDAAYFDRKPCDEVLERRFDWMLVVKFAATFAQPFSILYGSFQTSLSFDVQEALITLYTCSVYNIMHTVLFHYFFVLWSAHKRLAVLNACLERLMTQLQSQRDAMELAKGGQTAMEQWRLATAELHELAAVHLRVTRLVVRLNESNRFQMMAMLLLYIINLVTYGFYAILVSNGSLDITPGMVGSLAGMMSYVLLCVDLFLVYSSCGGITDCHRQAAWMLRAFRAFSNVPLEFEQQCELFSTQLVLHKLTISVSGLLSVTMNTSLTMWAFILRHTIIMVQFDREHPLH